MNRQNILNFYGSKLDLKLDSSELYDYQLTKNGVDYDTDVLDLSTPIVYNTLKIDNTLEDLDCVKTRITLVEDNINDLLTPYSYLGLSMTLPYNEFVSYFGTGYTYTILDGNRFKFTLFNNEDHYFKIYGYNSTGLTSTVLSGYTESELISGFTTNVYIDRRNIINVLACSSQSPKTNVKPWAFNFNEGLGTDKCTPILKRRTEKGWTLDFIFNRENVSWSLGSVFYYIGVRGENNPLNYADNNLSFQFTPDRRIKWIAHHYSGICATEGYDESFYIASGQTPQICVVNGTKDFNITIVFDRYKRYTDCNLENDGGWNDLIPEFITSPYSNTDVTAVTSTQLSVANEIEILNKKWSDEKQRRLGRLKIYLNGRPIYKLENWEEIIPSDRGEQSYIQSWGGGTGLMGGIHSGTSCFNIKTIKYYEEPLDFVHVRHNFLTRLNEYDFEICGVSCSDDVFGIVPTPLPTTTPTVTSSSTPAPTSTATETPVPTATNIITPTPTATVTSTSTPTETPTGTSTPIPTATVTVEPTSTPEPTPTPTLFIPNNDLTYVIIPGIDMTYIIIPNNDFTYTLIPINDLTSESLPNNDLEYLVLPLNDVNYTLIPNNDSTYTLIPNNDLTYLLLQPTPNPTHTPTPTSTTAEPTPTETPTLTPTPTPTSAGFQWMTINSVTDSTASGIGQNDITLSVTQSGGGMGVTNGVFNPTVFPEEYGVPFTGNQIQNINSGTFTATFSQPVTDALVAFASIGHGGLYVPIEVSAPFTPIFGLDVSYQNSVNGTQYTQLTGNEGYSIIRIDGTVTTVTFNYTESENYCNVCFGFVNQNTLPTSTPTPTSTETPTPTPTVTYYYYYLLNCNLGDNKYGRSTNPSLNGNIFNVDTNTCYTIVGNDNGPSYDYDLDIATMVTDCTDILCSVATSTPTPTQTLTPTATPEMATLTIIVPPGTPSIIFDGDTYTSTVTAGVVKNQQYSINSSDGTSNFWYWSGTGINLPASNSQNTIVFVTGNTATLEVNYLNQPTPTATSTPTPTPTSTETPTPTPTDMDYTNTSFIYIPNL